MGKNVTQKLIEWHCDGSDLKPGAEIGVRMDQTLTQDATGTLVMLALEAMHLDRTLAETSVQYVDHNLIQADHKNPDDHLFLHSACRRFGLWFSRPGNGVSHPLHMLHFGKPGKTLIGSDSHTCAAGSLGMFAVGAGGLDVALAMAGEPFRTTMPEVWGVRLTGALPDWVSAKDVILEMLRRHGVRGAVGRVIEYHGPGIDSLSAMDRHVIANMGAELGATTTVFPADAQTRTFLEAAGRADDFVEIRADPEASYDHEDEIDLSSLVPLIAKPSSPGNVVRVEEVAGEPIYQAYIGSSANPGFRDFAVAARMLEGKRISEAVSFDINPTSRSILEDLMKDGSLQTLVHAGARLHQAGCNGCIGMGQAPATGRNSLRTTPRNFPGRSGTQEDSVWLCSPETATASALRGEIADPRTFEGPYPRNLDPKNPTVDWRMFAEPPEPEVSRSVELVKGPNIDSMPTMDPLPDELRVPVLLKVDDDISTDEILPAGARVLPYRSNIPKIAEFCFEAVDPSYPARAADLEGPHAVVGGENYGQGSSREHAALAPRHLGLRLVVAKSFARIHHDNLVNFGVLPLVVDDPQALDRIEQEDTLVIRNLNRHLDDDSLTLEVEGKQSFTARHGLSEHQLAVLKAGGAINWVQQSM